MNIAKKVGPYVAVASFAAAGACITVIPPPNNVAATTPPSAVPTDPASPLPTATDTATATTSPSATASAPPAPTSTMPAYQVPDRPKGKPGRAKRNLGNGRPQRPKAAGQDAYVVWFDAGSWHVRTTTNNIEHRFQGVVVSEQGSIADVKPTRADFTDRIKAEKDTITFDFTTKTDDDGFDFNAAEDRCLNFYLLIDGKERADRINLGAAGTHPPSYSFQLCK